MESHKKIDRSKITPKEKWELYHEIFLNWLLHDNKLNKIAAAKALIAKTLIEFFCFEGKRNSEDWEDAEKRQQEFLSMIEKEGRNDLVESGRRMFEGTASRSVVWLIAYSEWLTLCENELSDNEIRHWIRNNPDLFQ
jgi:hypothetical protein